MEWVKKQHRLYDVLWRETNAIYEAWAKRRGLSYCELFVFLSLSERGECTQKKICEQWQLPKQTVNTIVKGLMERGTVVLETLQEDRRNKAVLLTAEGRAYVEQIVNELYAHEYSVLERMGRERAEALMENMALYNRLLREVE